MKTIGIKPFRPPDFSGSGDKALTKIHREVMRLLKRLHKQQHLMLLDLPEGAFDQIAGAIVEFAEDMHNDIGIWRTYEQYNEEFFNTPLPFTLKPGEHVDDGELFYRRLYHFLWIIMPEFDPGLILAPNYGELDAMTPPIIELLIERFTDVPLDSGVKHFLESPIKWGWEMKRKLVWLGQSSYLFRFFLGNYIEEQGGESEIPVIDDFICQQTTSWSGLGVIDILAKLVEMTEQQQRELRRWSERHMAIYKVRSLHLSKGTMTVLNLINDKPYQVKVGKQEMAYFRRNMYLQGSLVPWDGMWYWSGVQMDLGGTLPKKVIEQMKQQFRVRMSHVAYRYCDDLLAQARELTNEQYEGFLKFHGSDLVLYPDGKALAADLQKQFRQHNESISAKDSSSGKRRKWESHDVPSEAFESYDEMENGVAIYFNAGEGQEIIDEFNLVSSGLEKHGLDLTEDEEDLLRDFILSDVISPGFVRRVVQQYGSESISAAFFMPDTEDDEFILDYLLRRYKGHFYRTRYPSVSILPDTTELTGAEIRNLSGK